MRIQQPCNTVVQQKWERYPSSSSSFRCCSRHFRGDRDVSIILRACNSNGANSFLPRGELNARGCRGNRNDPLSSGRLFVFLARRVSQWDVVCVFTRLYTARDCELYQGTRTIFTALREKKAVNESITKISRSYTYIK